ncbi:helix-turn-helix domain-containing protein [Bacillus sp. RIT694]|uniref:helix-turn-helix domain-containing protein n=1 Tax=Bacillus sp. RIT694 TaxID=2666190 RepID=UPI0012AD1662|nr:helix-turn-helix domain-containing protein [Bacillus sp. RIT694]MRS25882.1 helix-turn-helix domain-containing protein [Bacillus sp. RIT694]
MNIKKMIDRENLFITRQELISESSRLLDEFMILTMSFKFDEAKKIKSRIDEINQEVQEIGDLFNTFDVVIGVEEASSILNLSSGTIKNMCAAGKIPAKKIGKTWILDKNLLEPSG